jgi:hypothetical protein
MRMTKLIVSFNRHFFVLALFACAIGVTLFFWWDQPEWRLLMGLGVGLAVYFMVASVLAAYIAYDVSDLYRLKWWPSRCLPRPPDRGLVLHAGFDPASTLIHSKYPTMEMQVFDFFHDHHTTEASIQRAHRLKPPTQPQEKIASEAWPATTASQAAVFVLNAAHELRTTQERTAFFQEAKRVLRSEGRIIVIEQLRDAVNFACFGPAAFHFFSRQTWLQAFRATKLTVMDEFRISPFLRAFVLR